MAKKLYEMTVTITMQCESTTREKAIADFSEYIWSEFNLKLGSDACLSTDVKEIQPNDRNDDIFFGR